MHTQLYPTILPPLIAGPSERCILRLAESSDNNRKLSRMRVVFSWHRRVQIEEIEPRDVSIYHLLLLHLFIFPPA